MTLGDLVVIFLLMAIFIAIGCSYYRKRKLNGKCSSGCQHCSHRDSCLKNDSSSEQ